MDVQHQLEIDRKKDWYLQVGAIDRRPESHQVLLYKLYSDAARALGGETPATIRRECKLIIGVPIMYAEDSKFKQQWDEILEKPLTREQKLVIMDFLPVSSLMNIEQESRYIEAILGFYRIEERLKEIAHD